jgi:CheY-like chemotaxis protein
VQDAGMNALVSKPFKPAVLFETIRKLVEEKLLDNE